MYVQSQQGKFSKVEIPGRVKIGNWRNVRIGHLTANTNRQDLVVVEGRGKETAKLKIYAGVKKPPYFLFKKPYYTLLLPFQAPDIEIADVNGDGINDICTCRICCLSAALRLLMLFLFLTRSQPFFYFLPFGSR